jgi:hypothetical protein
MCGYESHCMKGTFMSTLVESRNRTSGSFPGKVAKMGGATLAFFITMSVAFQAVATLGISSGLATNLYWPFADEHG